MRSFQPRALRAVLFVLASSLATASWADACDDRAAEKKLAGAAKTSFLKKCKADAAKAG